MAIAFDPYHKWLGIAPKDQPPNHYRLLGIDQYEADPDVISLASDQRMAHLRTFQTGQNASISQKLLNEIAAARLCLLTPAKKAAYDQALSAGLAGIRKKAVTPASTISPPIGSRPIVIAKPLTATSDAPSVEGVTGLASELPAPTSAPRRRARKQQPTNAPLLAAVAISVVAFVGTFSWWAMSSPTERKNPESKQSGDSQIASQLEPGQANHREAANPSPGSPQGETRAIESPILAKELGVHGVADPGDQSSADTAPLTDPGDEPQIPDQPYPRPDSATASESPDLIACWPLDEGKGVSSADTSGHHSSLTLRGGVTWVPGRFGQALAFDGKSGIAEAGSYLPDLRFPLTFSFWVRPAATQSALAGIFGNHSDAKLARLGLVFQQEHEQKNRFQFLYGDGDEYRFTNGVTLRPDVWQHVAIAGDDKQIVIYVGGIENTRLSATYPFKPNPGQNFKLGQGFSEGRYFNGAIDEVRVFGRALSADDVKGLARGQTAPIKSASTSDAPVLVRKPVPARSQLASAETKINDLFREDLATAKSPQELLAVAARVLELTDQTIDPIERFALLCQARDIAAKADLGTAMQTVDRLVNEYDLDRFSAQADCLDRAMAMRPAQADLVANRTRLATLAWGLADEAIASDNLAVAIRFGKIALAASQATKNRELIRQATARQNELKPLHTLWRAYSEARKDLADKPDDPKANYTVGYYLCMVRLAWDEGLPHLAKGSHDGLRDLARADLATPGTPADQVKVADRWWDSSAEGSSKGRTSMQLRGRHWYQIALPGLSGLEKARVEKRLAGR